MEYKDWCCSSLETTHILRIQLQSFSRCCVGMHYCNATLLFYWILSFQNIIFENFGSPMVVMPLLSQTRVQVVQKQVTSRSDS